MSLPAKATMWFFFGSILQKGIAFISTPIFTRLMSTDEFGEYNIYLSWLSVLTVILTLRLDYGGFNKGLTKYKNDKDGFTYGMQIIVTAASLIFIVLNLIFGEYISAHTNLSRGLTMAMALEICATGAISFWTVRERYDFKYKNVVFVSLLLAFLNAAIGMIAVMCSENKGIARIISSVSVQIVIGIVIYIINFVRGHRTWQKEYIIYALAFNIPLLPHYLSDYILDSFDKIMISSMVSKSATGIYSLASSLGMVVKVVTGSISNAYVPLQYRCLDEKNYKKIRSQITPILYIILGVILLFIAFAPEAMKILGTTDYYYAVYAVPPIAASAFFGFLIALFGNTLLYFGKNVALTVFSCIAAGLNIGLNYIFINIFGFVAAGYTTMICYFIDALCAICYANKLTKQNAGEHLYENIHIVIVSVALISAGAIFPLIYKYNAIRYSMIALIIILCAFFRKTIINVMKTSRN